MLGSLVHEYKQQLAILKVAIAGDDQKKVHEIDRRLLETWEKILDCETRKVSEKKQLADFLLDILVADQSGGNTAKQAKAKILSILDE